MRPATHNTCARRRAFGAGATGVGFASSAFSFARLALNVPSGMAGDRFGRKPLLVLGPLLMAAGVPACTTTPFPQRTMVACSCH